VNNFEEGFFKESVPKNPQQEGISLDASHIEI
jgi:hypothetical protein